MKCLADYKEEIHSCSKCGLCQFVCPIYKITGNDCTVSRGLFVMLKKVIQGELKVSGKINNYLDLCLDCHACSKFCPSGIDIVEVFSVAKAEYLKKRLLKKLILNIKNFLIFNLGVRLLGIFHLNKKSKCFEKKVIYFSGCSGKIKGNANVVKILNSLDIEVITPNFDCCGLPFFLKGDLQKFFNYMDRFYKLLDKYGDYDIVTNCASCEKALKYYQKFNKERKINVKNVLEYIREKGIIPELKGKVKTVTFHKPCNMDNYSDVKWLMDNTKNLEYVELKDINMCCGYNGVFNASNKKILSQILKDKRDTIKNTNAKIVLTSCAGCESALKRNLGFTYKVQDLIDFLAENIR